MLHISKNRLYRYAIKLKTIVFFNIISKSLAIVMLSLFYIAVGGIQIADELNITFLELLWKILLNENNVIPLTILTFLFTVTASIIVVPFFYSYRKKTKQAIKN